MTEHLPERLSIPGFRLGRRYEAIDADRRFFTFYDLDSPEVLFSKAYLSRYDNPTPWTLEIMSGWRSVLRTVCRRVAREGSAMGSYVAVVRWETPAKIDAELARDLRATFDDPAVVAIDLWQATAEQNPPSKEAAKRGGPDGNITAAVLVEATRVASAERAAVALGRPLHGLPAPASIGIYGLIALLEAQAPSS
jgi:hypothetical protein